MFVGMNGTTANTTITGAIVGSDAAKKLGSMLYHKELREVVFPADRDLAFGGWDISANNACETAMGYGIIPKELIVPHREELERIRPQKGIAGEYDVAEARESSYSLQISNFRQSVERIKKDITKFRKQNDCDECVIIYCAAPLRQVEYDMTAVKVGELEEMMARNSNDLTSAMAYAIGSIESKCAFADFTANITLEVPGIVELSERYGVPIAGRDGNTGQTLMKTVIGEMLYIRNFRLLGWYSTNILGNNDGRVLARQEHRALKMADKLNVLPPILGYSDFDHVVDISFYPPRGDNKEAWDNIDFLGWMSLPMSMKINWIGRDSILAGPLIVDLVKHLLYSMKKGDSGIQEHLAIYFKHPLKCGPIPFSQAFRKLLEYYGSSGAVPD